MKTCCIIGHRNFVITTEIALKVNKIVDNLIVNENVTEFLFGSKSNFIDYCYDIVTEYKNRYPNLKRIFVRAEYPLINDDYYKHLKTYYEDSYFYSEKLISNKFSYIRRNKAMIDKSDFCLFYYDKNYFLSTKTQSGTRIAYEYAVKKGKNVINVLNY